MAKISRGHSCLWPFDYSSIAKCYKVAGNMEEIAANIHLCVAVSIDRAWTLLYPGTQTQKHPRFYSLHQSSCVGKVIQSCGTE